MPNPENIIPPQKGEIRNPKGKPKGTKNRATIFKKWVKVLEKTTNEITQQEEELTQLDLMAIAAIVEAKSGNITALKEVLDSIYGKVTDKVDHTSKGESLNIINLGEGKIENPNK
jgi:vacuolar-type H+-ATPase subunit E/Vma4